MTGTVHEPPVHAGAHMHTPPPDDVWHFQWLARDGWATQSAAVEHVHSMPVSHVLVVAGFVPCGQPELGIMSPVDDMHHTVRVRWPVPHPRLPSGWHSSQPETCHVTRLRGHSKRLHGLVDGGMGPATLGWARHWSTDDSTPLT